MTAEIVIMNAGAVALAADSAITLSTKGGRKIYNSADKLFMLTRSEPVGIMFWGADAFMGVPWEVMVKTFRKSDLAKRRDSLREYALSFLDFLRDGCPQAPIPHEADYFRFVTLGTAFRTIKSNLRKSLAGLKSTSTAGVKAKASKAINAYLSKLSQAQTLPDMSPSWVEKTLELYGEAVEGAISDVFEELPLDKVARSRLQEIAGLLLSKDHFLGGSYSGAVVAGYGDKDTYPSTYAFLIEGRFNGKLKFTKLERKSQTLTYGSASVIPFAQEDMVVTFMDGINPNLDAYLSELFEKVLRDYGRSLVDFLAEAGASDVEAVRRQLTSEVRQLRRDFAAKAQHAKEAYWRPIMQAVFALPKDELASMAEALVNLTSFRRRVSTDDETVGGAVDVAVISKGDGFVWTKRKHYFDPRLNPHFFSKYYEKMPLQEIGGSANDPAE